ncbi:MAG: cation:proton antiporter [Caulobacterales bacterium]|nr:cation:proton antiporter [Caulobacterales bacterium]
MSPVHAPPFIREAVILLLAGLIVAPLCRRAKISPVLGYLMVGAAVGPSGLALIADSDGVREIAELGVILLLFSIGLELSWRRLQALRTLIFGLGTAQMLITAAVVGVIAFAWGNSPPAALILGVCFAFSSTAVAMQLLSERRETASPAGQASFAVLLFQDLAVAPALLLVQIVSVEMSGPGALSAAVGGAFLRAAIAIAAIMLIGRLVLRRLFAVVARERSPELFIAAAALTALATAWATNAAGLSTALGAFLAGLLLAETEFRTQVEADIEPFKGLMLGLFFMGVGMTLDPRIIAQSPVTILAAIVGLAVLKTAILAPAARAFGRTIPESIRVAALLSQAGEFAFVVIGAALVTGVLSEPVGQFMAAVVAGSMLFAPGFDLLGRAIARAVEDRWGAEANDRDRSAATLSEHVIIAGYGRVGQLVARALTAQNAAWTAVDRNAPAVARALAEGDTVLFGDAARVDILERAGLAGATALVVTLDDPSAAARAVAAALQRRPDLPVIARARDAESAVSLSALGVRSVVPESLEPGLQMAGEALLALGVPPSATVEAVNAVRSAELEGG